MTQEIVINIAYGGFSISAKAIKLYNEYRIQNDLLPHECDMSHDDCYCLLRSDPILIQVIKELGNEANGKHCELKIKSIEKDLYDLNCYIIDEYDGKESLIKRKDKYYAITKITDVIKRLDCISKSNDGLLFNIISDLEDVIQHLNKMKY